MGEHPRSVEGFDGSLDDLARSVGNMTYDQVSSFLEKLAEDINNQADADIDRGRKQLALKLYSVSDDIYNARNKMELAWKICEPYMKKD